MSKSSKFIHLHNWFHWFHKFLKFNKFKCTFLVFPRVLINTSLLRCLQLVFCTCCTEWTSTLQWVLGTCGRDGGRGGSGLRCGMVSSTSEYTASYCVYLGLVPAGAKSCMIDDVSGCCEENLMKVHMMNTCIESIKPQQTSSTVCGMVSNGVPLFTYMLPMFTSISIVHQITLVINAYLSDKCKSMFTTYTYESRRSTGRGSNWPEIKHNDQRALNLLKKLNKQLLIIVYVIM